jgi:Zn-dependent membrane protease YugP
MSASMGLGQYWWLFFFVPGLLLGLYAQFRLRTTYGRYIRVRAGSGVTGAQAAREILDRAGLTNMPVREVPGVLTDHYDPMRKALCLSTDNFHGRSLAALGVAAHEAGHALQHRAAYAPLKLRMALVPITSIASSAAIWITFLGYFAGSALGGSAFTTIMGVAVGLFAIITLFQVITLPVEFDASRRAKEQLLRLGLIHNSEHGAVSKVLNAAALTYVAGMVAALLQLLYLIMILRGDRD